MPQLTKEIHAHVFFALEYVPIVNYEFSTLEEGATQAAVLFNQFFGHLAKAMITAPMIIERMEATGSSDIKIGQSPYWIVLAKCNSDCRPLLMN